MKVCKECLNKGCGAFRDKCRKYQEEKAKKEAAVKVRRQEKIGRDYIKDTTFLGRTCHPTRSRKK